MSIAQEDSLRMQAHINEVVITSSGQQQEMTLESGFRAAGLIFFFGPACNLF